MAVYLGRAEHGGSPNDFKRVVLEWEGGELVVAPGKGDALEVEIKVGHEHEKHELESTRPTSRRSTTSRS